MKDSWKPTKKIKEKPKRTRYLTKNSNIYEACDEVSDDKNIKTTQIKTPIHSKEETEEIAPEDSFADSQGDSEDVYNSRNGIFANLNDSQDLLYNHDHDDGSESSGYETEESQTKTNSNISLTTSVKEEQEADDFPSSLSSKDRSPMLSTGPGSKLSLQSSVKMSESSIEQQSVNERNFSIDSLASKNLSSMQSSLAIKSSLSSNLSMAQKTIDSENQSLGSSLSNTTTSLGKLRKPRQMRKPAPMLKIDASFHKESGSVIDRPKTTSHLIVAKDIKERQRIKTADGIPDEKFLNVNNSTWKAPRKSSAFQIVNISKQETVDTSDNDKDDSNLKKPGSPIRSLGLTKASNQPSKMTKKFAEEGKKLWGMVKHVVEKQIVVKRIADGIKAIESSPFQDQDAEDEITIGPKEIYQSQRKRFQIGKFGQPLETVKQLKRPEIGRTVMLDDLLGFGESEGKSDTNSRLIRMSMEVNGFTDSKSANNMFQIVHNLERRKAGLSAMERVKYPTFEDMGPPLDATDTPILEYDEAAYAATNEEKTWKELASADDLISTNSIPNPSNLRRRGMLLARVGKFIQAEADLDKAIVYDPFNSDAYWHRHQLYLRANEIEGALKDLDSITTNNKLHLGAFQAKARIYQALGILKLASINYSNVIKLQHASIDAYYNRAIIFEALGESTFANEDFRVLRTLDPTNEHALFNLAVYNFQKRLWSDSLTVFLKLLVITPDNTEYQVYKGLIYANLARYKESFEAFSLAISIDPDNSQAYFQRGCLLENVGGKWAIENFSISLLLDDSRANKESYFRRGCLYAKIGEFELALLDLSAVIQLDSSHIKALSELGIIYMKQMKNYDKAFECFNRALKVDPTLLNVMLCKGELHELLITSVQKSLSFDEGKLSDKLLWQKAAKNAAKLSELAIKEYCKAIHMFPSNYLLYLRRGSRFLKQGSMQEATSDFHAAFELNASIAQTFMQRVLILSFQRRYKQIIKEYEERKKQRRMEDANLLILVAKARIRCNDFTGALNDLNSVVNLGIRSDPNIFLQRGICYEHLQDWEEASNQFSICIQLEPSYSKAYFHRGQCKIQMGKKSGIEDLDQAIYYDPKYFDAYLARATYCHSQEGEYSKAIDDCNLAIALEPTSLRTLILRGICKLELNQIARALADFNKAVDLDKSSAVAFFNRAIAYQMAGNLEHAIRDYSLVLLISNNAKAYKNRALTYWKVGDSENALLDLTAASKSFPNDPKLRGLLALCLHKVGKLQESLLQYTKAIELDEFMKEAIIGRGNVYAALGDLENSRRDYCRVIHRFPKCAEAYVNIAYTLQTEGHFKAAWVTFSMALAVDPRCVAGFEGRSVICLLMNNPQVALMDISNAHRYSSTNPEILCNRGVIFEALDDNVSALQQYKVAIEKSPKYVIALFNAGNLYLRQRLWERAISFYKRALDEEPQNIKVHCNIGIAYTLVKDIKNAMEIFDRAIEIDSENPDLRYNRGVLLSNIGQQAMAEIEFTKAIQLRPNDPDAYLKRGEARGKRLQWKEAMEDYKEYYELCP